MVPYKASPSNKGQTSGSRICCLVAHVLSTGRYCGIGESESVEKGLSPALNVRVGTEADLFHHLLFIVV